MKTIDITYIDTSTYTVTAHQDYDSESPAEWGNFTVVQFRDRGYSNYGDIDDYLTENGVLRPEVQAKLRAGKMFVLDYRSYSSTDGGHYSVNDDEENYAGRVVDSGDINGFIIFEDEYIKGTNFTQRRMYAQGDLATYTQWANGDVYYVNITDSLGREVDSCGGLYGTEAVDQFVAEAIPGATVEVNYEF